MTGEERFNRAGPGWKGVSMSFGRYVQAPSTPAEINAEIAELAILMDRARKTSAAQAKLIEAMSASFNSIIEADVTEI